MLKNPERYEEFCNQTAGSYVEHVAFNGEGELEWVAEYENKFGKLDGIWFQDKFGNTKEEALKVYKESGNVRMSWDCGPVIED